MQTTSSTETRLSGSESHRDAYNATVCSVRIIHEDLRIIRIRPDFGPLEFEAGQYITLGLGDWEHPIAGSWTKADPNGHRLIRRAYSISARVLDREGNLLPPQQDTELEFYIALVRGTEQHPSQLTPRLFALRPGERLFAGSTAKGNYTLKSVKPNEHVLFAATGTGEAPHNAMIAQLIATGHSGPITSVVGARYRLDLGYADVHERLMRLFPQYRSITLTTREPENVNPELPGYVGRQYVQDFICGGTFFQATGRRIDPMTTRVFVCGNARMVGAPNAHQDQNSSRTAAASGASTPHGAPNGGLCEALEKLGFVCDRPNHSGNVHFEQYGE
ncbi:MAG: ferredoxin--NADP reductase [Planctomyces sp.]|nr:ferredoxin--NADP reductase [Planctomyces sp.]